MCPVSGSIDRSIAIAGWMLGFCFRFSFCYFWCQCWCWLLLIGSCSLSHSYSYSNGYSNDRHHAFLTKATRCTLASFCHGYRSIRIPSYTAIALTATTARSSSPVTDASSSPTGKVAVCINTSCRARGSDTVLTAFKTLVPESVPVTPIKCLGRCNRGPNICVTKPSGDAVEISTVQSADEIAELLRVHMGIAANKTKVDALRHIFDGDTHLRNENIIQAVESYSKGLDVGDKSLEGILRLVRGSALLERVYSRRATFMDLKNLTERVLPNSQDFYVLLSNLTYLTGFVRDLMVFELIARIIIVYKNLEFSPHWVTMKPEEKQAVGVDISDIKSGEQLIERSFFALSMYEVTLASALDDLLTATVLLPRSVQAWRRAADALREMHLFQAAIEYYRRAIKLEPALFEILIPVIERLKIVDLLVTKAIARGYPEEEIMELINE